MKFSRSGDFEKAARAFDLTGAVYIDLLSTFKTPAVQATGVECTALLSVQTVEKWRR